jgi:hypothetical protein
MSTETSAILAAHITPGDICAKLRSLDGVTGVGTRNMHKPEYKIIEFTGADGARRALNVFLNSYAADDHADVYSGASTLLTLEFTPDSHAILSALVRVTGGYVRRINGEPWERVTAGA